LDDDVPAEPLSKEAGQVAKDIALEQPEVPAEAPIEEGTSNNVQMTLDSIATMQRQLTVSSKQQSLRSPLSLLPRFLKRKQRLLLFLLWKKPKARWPTSQHQFR
jgi:hypothetical protein